MARDFSITVSQLTTLNTWLGSNCDTALYANLDYEGTRAICIGVNASAPTGTASAPPSTILTQTGTKTAASMGPTPTGIISRCQQFYTVQSGDSCYKIATTFGITVAEFYQWNPSGMSPVPLILDLSSISIMSMMETIPFVCLRISNTETVGSGCENLWLGYAYCVEGPPSATTSVKPTATSPGPTSPTQSGITPNCDEYYTVASGDSCSKIETQFDITFARLYQWNPAIGSNCESLWVGYAVCVAVSS
jgi:LysM repeat protein